MEGSTVGTDCIMSTKFICVGADTDYFYFQDLSYLDYAVPSVDCAVK